MKKILAFLLLLISFQAIAQNDGNSTIKISFSDGQYIAVNVDGTYYDDKSKSITVSKLDAGEHKLLIYKANGPNPPKNMRPPIVKEMTVNTIANGTTTIKLSSEGNSVSTNTASNAKAGTRRSSSRYNYSKRTYSSSVSSNSGLSGNGKEIVERAYEMVPDVELNELKKTAAKSTKDADRIQVLQEGIGTRAITTAQTGRLLDLIKKEDERMKLARWCYSHLSDQENFKILKTKFKSSAAKKAIDKIASGKQ